MREDFGANNDLIEFVAGLYYKDDFSEITISYANKTRSVHKFVLVAMSDGMSHRNLNDDIVLKLDNVSTEVGDLLIKLLYLQQAEIVKDEKFIIQLYKAANLLNLPTIKERCEIFVQSY